MNQNESNAHTIRELLGKSSHWTNRMPFVAAEVEPVETARIELQVPRVVGIARIRRGGPVAAERAEVGEVGVAAEAGSGEKDAF